MADAAAGDVDGAAARYRRAMELEPTSSRPHNGLGVPRLAQGRPAEVLAEFDAAAGLHPELAEPQNNRGAALGRLGRIAEAAEAFARTLAADPGNRAALDNLQRERGPRRSPMSGRGGPELGISGCKGQRRSRTVFPSVLCPLSSVLCPLSSVLLNFQPSPRVTWRSSPRPW